MFLAELDVYAEGVPIPVSAQRIGRVELRFGVRLLYDATEQARATERAQRRLTDTFKVVARAR